LLQDPYRPIQLNLPLDVLEQLTRAAQVMGMTRADLIRRSICRDLQFVLESEVTLAEAAKEKRDAVYKHWQQVKKT
jgi:hypothetical protein